MNMKHRTLINRITAVIFGLVMISAGVVGVFAEEEPVVTEQPIVTVPVTEEPIWTDTPTEPPTDPPTVPPTEPVTEATTQAPTQATTAPATAQETTEAHTESGGVIHDNTDTTEFVPPTIPKTVSEKSYTTNAAAGIISWICVIVGLIVIFAVAVSTKLSGYRAGRRV